MKKGQLAADMPTWSHAKGSGAPDFVKAHERAHSKNTLDPAKAPAPNSGQTAGGSRQGGKRGSNSPKE